MINSLTLAGTLPVKKEKVEKEHVVLTGKMTSIEGQINFYLEDKLGGNYKLVLMNNDSSILIKNGIVLKEILKKRVWSKINYSYLKRENDIYYLIIPFSIRNEPSLLTGLSSNITN